MSYLGQIASIPLGLGGFNGNKNVYRTPITDLLIARNVTYDGDQISKIPGAAPFDSNAISGTPTAVGAIDWQPNATTRRIISAWSNGSVYRENAGDVDDTTVVSGLAFVSPAVFIAAGKESTANNRKLFMFAEDLAPRYIDGDATTFTAITASADWSAANQPNAAVFHDSRLAAWGNKNGPHNIYFSTLANHSDFSSGPIVEVFPGDGLEIRAAISLLQTRLYVFKYPKGIYWFDTLDFTDSDFPITQLRDDVGCAGAKAIARVGNDVWFISELGHIHSLTAVQTSEDLRESDITARLNLEDWTFDNVDLDRIKFASLVYDSAKKQVNAFFTSKDADHNGIRLIFDVSDPANPRLAIDDRAEIFEAPFIKIESDQTLRLYSAGEGGLIYKLNQTSRNVNSSAYTGEFRTVDTDLGYVSQALSTAEKRFDYVEIVTTPTGNYDLTFDLIIDGIVYDTYTVNLGFESAQFGSALFGTSRFGGQSLANHKVLVGGQGRRVAIRAYNSGLNQNFAISEILIYFKPLGTIGTN